MSDRPAWSSPPRLSSNRQLAELLERANTEYRTGLDEPGAFVRLSERVRAREPERGSWQRGALAVAALACAGLSAWWWLPASTTPGVAFGPEVSTTRQGAGSGAQRNRAIASGPLRASGDTVPGEAVERGASGDMEGAGLPTRIGDPASTRERGAREQGPAAGATEGASEALGVGSIEHAAREKRSARRESLEAPLATPTLEAPKSAADQDEVGGSGQQGSMPRRDCLELANQGEYRAAEQCFGERATGAGLSAEMALYEKARLRRDVLHDARGALEALNEHRVRFPQGSLRPEVNLSRVELLAELGRGREALRESEALLASPTGKERAAELHVLRGNVYRRDLSDLRAADREYALAEQLGGALGAEASQLRGAVLEALGDVPGALSAYRRYLSVAGRPRSADVSRRVEQLSSSSGGEALP